MIDFGLSFLDRQFLGVTLQGWFILLAVWATITFVFFLLRKVSLWRLRKISKRTKNVVDDVIYSLLAKTKFYFLLALALYLAVAISPLTERIGLYISRIAFLVLLVQVIQWGNQVITDWIQRYKERKLEEDAAAVTSMQAVGFVARLLLYATIVLVALDNFGIDITAMVAGLGIGGIAVALALQNILGDLFASLSIVLDKPFVVGDFLIVNDYIGTVQQVGLKTTRLRSLSGEQIVFSNSDLLNSRIRNYKRMFERRIVFSFGVVYDTPLEKLEKIPDMVREIIESKDPVRFDRAHFHKYGDFSLDFEVVYHVLVPDYNTYMDIQQSINLELFGRFESERIEFAFPTQTVYVSRAEGNSQTTEEQVG